MTELLSTERWDGGLGRFLTVFTPVAKQGQAPKAKVGSLVYCLYQCLPLTLLPTQYGWWWAEVQSLNSEYLILGLDSALKPEITCVFQLMILRNL